MTNIILFDSEVREQLLPLTFTRPVADLRVGILTIKEKWELHLKATASFITQDYLASKYPIEVSKENYLINGSVLPSEQLCRLIRQLEDNEALLYQGDLIAGKLNEEQFEHLLNDEDIEELKGIDLGDTPFERINNRWDIYQKNANAIAEDFKLVTKGRISQALSPTNTVIGNPDWIFLEEGAKVEAAILNTNSGPIYIGKNAEIMEGVMIRGGVSIGDYARVKMGAKIYGATTIGPYCTVAGEVNNSVLWGYSNKGHEGYLGNAVLGQWCNLGADTNCSNLKNTWDGAKCWDYNTEKYIQSGQRKLGLIMGDHSKAGINTMFNTATVVGVSANVFGGGFPSKFIPSFSWGGQELESYRIEKAFDTATAMMKGKAIPFDIQERLILIRIFEETKKYRTWETA